MRSEDEEQGRSQLMFSYGFDHGNYAGSYEFEPDRVAHDWLEEWLEALPDAEHLPLNVKEPTPHDIYVYRLGALIGLFASFEDKELPWDLVDLVCSAREEARRAPWSAGVAID